MARHDWLIAAPIAAALGVVVLVAVVLNLRSPDPPEDLQRAFSTPVAIPDGTVWVRIDLGAALERAGGDWDDGFEFEIREEDVVARSEDVRVGREMGPAVLRGRARVRYLGALEQHVLEVTFDDTWDRVPTAEPEYPTILDAEGYPLTLGSGSVGCSKDAAGRVGPGETSIGVVVEPDEVEILTFVLGPAHLDDPC